MHSWVSRQNPFVYMDNVIWWKAPEHTEWILKGASFAKCTITVYFEYAVSLLRNLVMHYAIWVQTSLSFQDHVFAIWQGCCPPGFKWYFQLSLSRLDQSVKQWGCELAPPCLKLQFSPEKGWRADSGCLTEEVKRELSVKGKNYWFTGQSMFLHSPALKGC